jgi:hypothetical protein
MFNGKLHYKWSFSIATLNYQKMYLTFGYTSMVPPETGATGDVAPLAVGSGEGVRLMSSWMPISYDLSGSSSQI